MTSGEQYDWTVLDRAGIADVVRQSAHKVARHYNLTAEDLEQEASLMVCSLDSNLRDVLGELGILQYRLEQDLSDYVRTEVRRRGLSTSFERRAEVLADIPPAYTPPRDVSPLYDTELVESLIPAVWDEGFCYGMQMEGAPDPDMPRGSVNKATGNTLAAHIADIRRAWSLAPLTLKQRRALLLRFGFGFDIGEVASMEGVTHQTASERVRRSVEIVETFLNFPERTVSPV